MAHIELGRVAVCVEIESFAVLERWYHTYSMPLVYMLCGGTPVCLPCRCHYIIAITLLSALWPSCVAHSGNAIRSECLPTIYAPGHSEETVETFSGTSSYSRSAHQQAAVFDAEGYALTGWLCLCATWLIWFASRQHNIPRTYCISLWSVKKHWIHSQA